MQVAISDTPKPNISDFLYELIENNETVDYLPFNKPPDDTPVQKKITEMFDKIAKSPEFNSPEAVKKRRSLEYRRHLPIQLTRDYEKEGFPFLWCSAQKLIERACIFFM